MKSFGSLGWLVQKLNEAQRYLTALLPSATAPGTRGLSGFPRT
jgi:hypothetical protein